MDEGEVFDTNYDDQSVASSVSEGPPQGNWQNNDRTMEPLNLESRQPSATNLGNTEKSWRNITDSTDVSANISAITENPSPRSLHTSNSNETQLHFPTTTVPSAVTSQGILYSDRLDSPNNIENKSPPPSPLHPAHRPPVSPVKTSHKHSSHIRDTTTSPTSTTAKINYGPVWKPGFKNRRHESSDLLKTSFPAGFQLKTTKDKFFYQQVSPPRYQMDDSYVTSSQTQSQTQSNKFSFHDWTKGGSGVIGGDSEFDDSADEGDHFNHGDPYMDVAGPLLRDIQRARLSMEVSTRGSIETDPSCQIFKAPIFTQRPSSKKEPQRRSQTPLSAPKVFHAPASLPSLPVASALIRPYQTQKDYPPPWRPTSPKATTKTLASVQSSTTISTYDDWLQYKRSNLHQKVWKKKGNLTDFNYSAHSFNGCNDYDEMKYIPSPIHYIPTPLPLSIELEIYTLHQFNQFPLHELNTNTINSNNNTNRSIDTINSNTNNSNNSPQQQQKRGKAGSISSQIATPTMNASTSSLNTAIPPPHLVSSSSYSKLTRASLLETINNNNNNNNNSNTNTNTTNNNHSKTFEELQCNILTLIPSNMTFIDLQQHIIKDIIKQIHDLFIPSLPSLTTHIDKVNHQYHEEKNQSYLYENIDEKRLILMIYHYDYAIHQWKIINNEIEWVQVKHYHHHYYLQQQLYLQQQQQQYNHKNNEKDMKETLEIIQSQGLNMKLMYCIELLSEQYLLKQIQKNYEIRKQMIEKDRMNISLQQLTEVLDKEQIKKRKKYISSSSSSLLLPSQQAAFQPLPSYNNYDGEGRDAVSSGQFNNYDMDDQGLGSIVRPAKAKSLKKLVITKSMFLPTQSQSTYETSHQRRNSRTLAMSPMSQLNDSLTINSDHLNSVNGDTLLQTSQQIQHTKKLKSLQLSSSTSSPLLSSGASILYPKQSTVLKQLQEDAQKSIPKLQSFAEQLQSRLLKTKF